MAQRFLGHHGCIHDFMARRVGVSAFLQSDRDGMAWVAISRRIHLAVLHGTSRGFLMVKSFILIGARTPH